MCDSEDLVHESMEVGKRAVMLKHYNEKQHYVAPLQNIITTKCMTKVPFPIQGTIQYLSNTTPNSLKACNRFFGEKSTELKTVISYVFSAMVLSP